MTQEEFDSLAIFVAVVEELKREPFFSEDNHDHLAGNVAVFCHPMFLKSAVLPFRKIWMERERCAFRKRDGTGGIRDLVFREFPDHILSGGLRYWFYEHYDSSLKTSFGYGWAKETKQEVINLWLNTQLAHTGPNNPAQKKAWESDLADFNECDSRIGREKFEFLFRSSIVTLGSIYTQFEEQLAFPLFQMLRNEKGMIPSFEADVALKYNPYPNPNYKIIFDDVFWHLKRETEEETIDRLLERQHFTGLRQFLHAIFPKDKKHEAIRCVCDLDSLDAVLKKSNTFVLDKNLQPEGNLVCRSSTHPNVMAPDINISFDVYDGPKVLFRHISKELLSRVYVEFRTLLFQERKQQRQPDKLDRW